MTIGEKLKLLRKKRGMTQKELAGDVLTRNMLSQIERGAALPSYTTLAHLSVELQIDPSYFFDGAGDLAEYDLRNSLPLLKKLYSEKRYTECIDFCAPYSSVHNDELSFILSDCHYHLAIGYFKQSDFSGAVRHFDLCEGYLSSMPYKPFFAERISFFRSVIKSFDQSSANELPTIAVASFERDEYLDYVIYSFLDSLIDRNQSERAAAIYNVIGIKNEFYRSHFNARIAASLHNYDRAKELLWSVVSSNVDMFPFLYKVYNDLERYCKATDDYEGAYRCLSEKQKYGPAAK